MISTSRCILTLAAIAASASISHAGMTQKISLADSLLKYLESKGYQPSYGFSQSPQDDRISALLSIVGGHLSAPNPPQSSGVTISGAGTLTLTGTSGGTLTLTDGTLTLGNSGFSGTPGPIRVNGGFGQGATTGSPLSLGSASTTGTTQDPSTLTIWPWTQSLSSPGTGLVSNQLSNLDVPWFSNPWNGAVYSIDYSGLATVTEIVLVPEPSALLLGGITGSLALLRRRRSA